MNNNFTLLMGLVLCALLFSCQKESNTQNEKPKKDVVETVYEEIYIDPSVETDYPKLYRDLGLPIFENTEIVNQGDDFDKVEDAKMIQLQTKMPTAEIKQKFEKSFDNGEWEKGNINIYAGAQEALLMKKGDEVQAQILIVDKTTHRRVAIIFSKPKVINPDDY